jgi:hypothetical protein
MRHSESSAPFLSRFMRPQRAIVASDPADYGTAFGLDLSMEFGIPEEAPAAAPKHKVSAMDAWLARWRRRA